MSKLRLAELPPIYIGHHEVEQDRIEMSRSDLIQCLEAVNRLYDVIPIAMEHVDDVVTGSFDVINDEHSRTSASGGDAGHFGYCGSGFVRAAHWTSP